MGGATPVDIPISCRRTTVALVFRIAWRHGAWWIEYLTGETPIRISGLDLERGCRRLVDHDVIETAPYFVAGGPLLVFEIWDPRDAISADDQS